MTSSRPSDNHPAHVTTRFIARQPIFDRACNVVAYELLCRSSAENCFDQTHGDIASAQVIHNSFMEFGLDTLVGAHKAYINFTRNLLLQESFAVFPSDRLVVEVLESVEPDDDIIEACKKLKSQGFLLALDDFVYDAKFEPLLALADIVKIDFLATGAEQRRWFAERFASTRVRLLAEKLETQEAFHEALDLGYAFFQGYFFCKPEIKTRRTVPGVKQSYLRLLSAVNRPDIDFADLEQIIKHDTSLSLKLLKYLNSPIFARRHEVKSIKEVLMMLGLRGLKLWTNLATVTTLCEDKPPELMVTCLVRARFCELLAPVAGLADHDFELFLVGLLSGLDAAFDRPMETLVAELAVEPTIGEALLDASSPLGKVLAFARAYERGQWPTVVELASALGLAEATVAERYCHALDWADEINRV